MPFKPMTSTQQFEASINPLNRLGKPAPIDGEAVWTSNDPAIVSVTSTGPKTALVVATGGDGPYTISVSADVDMGDGVTTVTDQDTGTVTQAMAATLGIGQTDPVEQP